MKIRPLHDRILIKRLDEEEKSKGGIIIPDTAKEKPQQGKVIAAGKGKTLENGKVYPPDVKFKAYASRTVLREGLIHSKIPSRSSTPLIPGLSYPFLTTLKEALVFRSNFSIYR